MAENNTEKCLPRRRFPDFKNDGEWEMYPLEELFLIRNGYTPSKSNPEFWKGGTIPWFRMEDIRLNGNILSDSIQHITPQAVKGTGLFPAYSIIVATTATIGEHALIIVDSLANQQFTFLTKRKSKNDRIDMMFFHQYMFIIDEWCKRNTNSGGLLSVNMPAFRRINVPLPSVKEQKMIASCLSSLDARISALKAKMEQLKAHKKGLMQNLFPAPGKTLPEFRFPEYVDSGEWATAKLDDIIKTVSPPKKLQSSEYYSSGRYPIIDQSKDFTCGYSNDESAVLNKDSNKMIVFGDHTCVLKFVSFPFIQGADGIKVFESKIPKTVSTHFLYYYLSYSPVEPVQYKRHFFELKEKEIKYPLGVSEQSRITTCLSSLDSLITASREKLNQLIAHKHGLVRQLFPSLKD